MEGFSASTYQPYAVEGSPPRPPEMMLAECHPKKPAGRKKFNETRHPVYRGIRQRNAGKWVCETREPNKKSRIWLGTFPTAEMAARAHDVAAIALRGRSACLNFADSAWRLPVPASRDTKDIQLAAAEAAEAFRPQSQAAAEESAAAAEESAAAASASSSAVGEEREMGWMDEDFFGMPEIVAQMYNGMMLSPPPQDYADMADDYQEYDDDLPLWSY